jgi:hypothetical protein
MANGDDDPPSSGSGNQSSQFPPRVCPKCRGRDIPCDLCNGTTPETRVVSRFKAAAFLSSHPEYHDTPEEFPATKPPRDDGEA